MAKTTLNAEGDSAAHALIRAGHYDMAAAWEFSAEDGNRLLGPVGDDWDKFGRWHLGEDPSEPRATKAHWKYPYGKDGKVYRRAVAAIRSRASQNGDDAVYDAAGRLMAAMDEEEDKKEGIMPSTTNSRFGHFAGPIPPVVEPTPAARRAEDDADDAEAKRKAEEEAKRKEKEMAEEEAKRRRARRARKGRKARHAEQQQPDDEDDDGDDAADDDEDEDDEEEMKKAQAAGHAFALDAAFRAGARAQRRRCAAILSAKSAGTNPVLALSLAFETSMDAAAAIAVLDKTPAARGGFYERMAGSAVAGIRVGPGTPEAPRGPAAVAATWDHVLKDFAPPAR